MIDVWALERLFRDAWPALQEIEADGWIARLTGGDTRRPNAINPLGPEAGNVLCALDLFAPVYAAANLRQIFRIPDFCSQADETLATAGLSVEGTTRTIAAHLADNAMPVGQDLVITPEPSPEWIAARVGPDGDPATQALLARLTVPAVFVTVKCEGEVAAIGYSALGEKVAVIESIRTMPRFRRRGFGNVCMNALMTSSYQAGAIHACLQVDAANIAGLALYAGLGFDMHLYDYHYRVPA